MIQISRRKSSGSEEDIRDQEDCDYVEERWYNGMCATIDKNGRTLETRIGCINI